MSLFLIFINNVDPNRHRPPQLSRLLPPHPTFNPPHSPTSPLQNKIHSSDTGPSCLPKVTPQCPVYSPDLPLLATTLRTPPKDLLLPPTLYRNKNLLGQFDRRSNNRIISGEHGSQNPPGISTISQIRKKYHPLASWTNLYTQCMPPITRRMLNNPIWRKYLRALDILRSNPISISLGACVRIGAVTCV